MELRSGLLAQTAFLFPPQMCACFSGRTPPFLPSWGFGSPACPFPRGSCSYCATGFSCCAVFSPGISVPPPPPEIGIYKDGFISGQRSNPSQAQDPNGCQGISTNLGVVFSPVSWAVRELIFASFVLGAGGCFFPCKMALGGKLELQAPGINCTMCYSCWSWTVALCMCGCFPPLMSELVFFMLCKLIVFWMAFLPVLLAW